MQPIEYETLRAVEDEHWWYAIQRELVLNELHLRLPENAQLLDAGCGTGGMMALLGKWFPQGIDIAVRAVELCCHRGLTNVTTASVNALPFEDATFDAVLSLDVLYHDEVDEQRALKEVQRVLQPGGLLILNLPAFDCLQGGHDAVVCGARRYTANQVSKLLHAHGFKIEMTHYWNAWLFLPLLFRRNCGPASQSDLKMPSKWINTLLARIGKKEARACRWLRVPFGSSLFTVARKPQPE